MSSGSTMHGGFEARGILMLALEVVHGALDVAHVVLPRFEERAVGVTHLTEGSVVGKAAVHAAADPERVGRPLLEARCAFRVLCVRAHLRPEVVLGELFERHSECLSQHEAEAPIMRIHHLGRLAHLLGQRRAHLRVACVSHAAEDD